MASRLEHIDDVPGRIFDTKGSTERLIGWLIHNLNIKRNQCSIRRVRVVHNPPEFNTIVDWTEWGNLVGAPVEKGASKSAGQA